MKEEEINTAISIVRLENEQLTLKKTEYELRQIQKDFNLPFYRSTEFIRPLVSGLSLALIFSAYIQYIFIPTQNNLNQEIDTAEFIIQKKKNTSGFLLRTTPCMIDQPWGNLDLPTCPITPCSICSRKISANASKRQRNVVIFW